MLLFNCAFWLGAGAVGAHSLSQENPEWRAVDAATGQISDIAGLEELARDFPHSGSIRLRLLNAHAKAGDREAIYTQIMWLTERGYQFSARAEAQLVGMFDGLAATKLAEVFAQDRAPLAVSDVVATVPAEARLVEGVALDVDGTLFVSSVVSQQVWAQFGGEWQALDLGSSANVSGIGFALDGVKIYATSADLGMLPLGARYFFGLISARPGEAARRYPAPAGANLSDLHIAGDGSIYASDPTGGGIYRLASGDEVIETFIAPGSLRSPQGLVESEDGKRLYVSDYRYGLAVIDLETRGLTRLDADFPILLDGIDALLRHGEELIAVQNGTSPMRIVALKLAADGHSITDYRELERANPDWTEPLGAAIHGDNLYYIGNGQWALYEPGGALKQGAEAMPTQVRRLSLVQKPVKPPK